MIRFLTGGESHGRCLTAIIEGMVAGLALDASGIDKELLRRQGGHGRGGRMQIEKDKVEILSGVRQGVTIGSPITLRIENRDFKIDELPVIKMPRPGHADLPGVLKYGREDIRDVLERSSARETAARVAVGAVCRLFMSKFGVEIISHVVSLGGIHADATGMSFAEIRKAAEDSPVRCACSKTSRRIVNAIDAAKRAGDTLGGVFEVQVAGLVPGIGSHVHYDRRLSARLAAALMSIQAVKGVEIGMGFEEADLKGSEAHDEIVCVKSGKACARKTNRAGGIEGGMTNGEILRLRGAMKPLSTLMKPLASVHIDTKKTGFATVERSDVTAVPACGVVAEAMTAFALANGYMEKFGGDSMKETLRNFNNYKLDLRKRRALL